ncbi:hypothetical protein BC628DRAFT_125927 [Trametes gibbosa]|nr:hypothetical protein BC628DRAFT_125927 [Trametes gibbosa]
MDLDLDLDLGGLSAVFRRWTVWMFGRVSMSCVVRVTVNGRRESAFCPRATTAGIMLIVAAASVSGPHTRPASRVPRRSTGAHDHTLPRRGGVGVGPAAHARSRDLEAAFPACGRTGLEACPIRRCHGAAGAPCQSSTLGVCSNVRDVKPWTVARRSDAVHIELGGFVSAGRKTCCMLSSPPASPGRPVVPLAFPSLWHGPRAPSQQSIPPIRSVGNEAPQECAYGTCLCVGGRVLRASASTFLPPPVVAWAHL